MAMISVDMFCGEGVNVYWDESACCSVFKRGTAICIEGNKPFFESIITQMVYFSSNDTYFSSGTHIHYDNSFGHNYRGDELILELIPPICHTTYIYEYESQKVLLDTSGSIDDIYSRWDHSSKVIVTTNDGICLLANRQGFMSLATILSYLIENNDYSTKIRCMAQQLSGWEGSEVVFNLADS